MAFSSENVALVNELAHRLNDNTRRIRVLEEKVRNFELQISNHDQRLMDANKETNTLAQTLGDELAQIKERLVTMEIDAQNLRTELKKAALKTDLKEVQDYIELISPVTSKYVTRGELGEIVQTEIKKLMEKRKERQ